MFTTSLLFAGADRGALPAIRQGGLPAGTSLYSSIDEAQKEISGCILAIDAFHAADFESDPGSSISPEIIQNISPYRAPSPVTAAGGFVLRRAGEDSAPELLLIYRRGVWDLPKGKLDRGETTEDCARREVCEELGIDEVTIEKPLGETVHGYPHKEDYAVKTTHWFAMTTPSTAFTPERKEKIEKVEWVSLPEAHMRLGFETLRRHLEAVRTELVDANIIR